MNKQPTIGEAINGLNILTQCGQKALNVTA